MTKIYRTYNFCSCGLCRGSQRITSALDREAADAARSGDYETLIVGGRNPRLITYPRGMVVVSYSAGGRASEDLDRLSEQVLSGSDSSHGCWKVRENQSFSLHWGPEDWEQWGKPVEVIETRG